MKRNKEELKQDALEQKYINAARKAKRKCFYPVCPNYAINSHILQENGILNQIAINGKFMEYARATPFRRDGFVSTGVNASDMFTFNGFCSTHDASIFNEVENCQSDFVEPRHQLLFAYRGLLNELFKTQVVTDYFNKVFQDKNISYQRKEGYKKTRAKRLLALKETQYYKMLIEKELFDGVTNSNFKFYRFELPKIEIATSTIYGRAFHKTLDYDETFNLNPFSDEYIPVFKPVFINLIPREKSLLIVLGYVITTDAIESIPTNKISSLRENEILKLLSRILIKIETWGMSQSLHDKLKSQGKLAQYFMIRDKWISTSFNHPHPFDVPDDFNLFKIQPSEILGKSLII